MTCNLCNRDIPRFTPSWVNEQICVKCFNTVNLCDVCITKNDGEWKEWKDRLYICKMCNREKKINQLNEHI